MEKGRRKWQQWPRTDLALQPEDETALEPMERTLLDQMHTWQLVVDSVP